MKTNLHSNVAIDFEHLEIGHKFTLRLPNFNRLVIGLFGYYIFLAQAPLELVQGDVSNGHSSF